MAGKTGGGSNQGGGGNAINKMVKGLGAATPAVDYAGSVKGLTKSPKPLHPFGAGSLNKLMKKIPNPK